MTASFLGRGIYVDGNFDGDITNSATIQVSEGNGTGSHLYGIKVSDTFTGNLTNDSFIQVQGDSAKTRGIEIGDVAVGSTIQNSGTILSNSDLYAAYGINVENNYGSITNTSLLNIYSRDYYSIGIYTSDNSGAITNTGTIRSKSYSNSYDAYGIWVDANGGSITNDGTIDVYSKDMMARGIVDGSGSGTITNNASRTITVETINGEAQGIYAYQSDITNSGTITANKDGVLDYKAVSLYAFLGDVTNTYGGSLHGNINVYAGTLTNSGTISLPHNANSATTAASINYFSNESTGILTIGLQTNGTTTTYSQLVTSASTFEDGSTINVDVTSGSTNVGNIAGERLNDVVSAVGAGGLTVNGTINVTDNSALLNFEIVDDVNSLQDDTIDLNVVAANVGGGGGNIENTSELGLGNNNTQSAAIVLDTIQAGNHPQMASVFTALNNLSTNTAVAKAVESTTPQATSATVGAAGQISNGIAGIVEQRQNIVMGGGLNSGDEMFSNKNAWVKTFGSLGKQDNVDGLNGFDVKAYGIGMGIDAEVKENQTLGFAFFYTNASVDVNNVSQTSDLDVFTTLIYGNAPIIDDKTKFLYQVGYAWQKTTGKRDVFTEDTAESKYTSKTASLDLKVVRDYKVNDKLLLQPMISTTYRHFTNPEYSETGAGALNLNVQKFTSSELLASVGTMSYYKLDENSKIIGNVNVGYDFHDRQQGVISAYQGASTVTFDTTGIDNGRWSYEAGVGFERDLDENSNINFSYNYQAQGSTFANNTFSAKYVYKF